MFLLLSLLACGGGEAPKAPEPAPVAAPAPAAPAAPAPVAVGPDGPEHIAIPAIASISTDPAVVKEGEAVWAAKGCGACHKFDQKLVGPALAGVFTRRTIPWVERMIVAPDVMIKEDPQAKKLFAEMMTPMSKQNVSDEELPKLLAYMKAQGG